MKRSIAVAAVNILMEKNSVDPQWFLQELVAKGQMTTVFDAVSKAAIKVRVMEEENAVYYLNENPVTKDHMEELNKIAEESGKIPTIKRVREITGAGLKTAKDFVEDTFAAAIARNDIW